MVSCLNVHARSAAAAEWWACSPSAVLSGARSVAESQEATQTLFTQRKPSHYTPEGNGLQRLYGASTGQ